MCNAIQTWRLLSKPLPTCPAREVGAFVVWDRLEAARRNAASKQLRARIIPDMHVHRACIRAPGNRCAFDVPLSDLEACARPTVDLWNTSIGGII